MAELLLPAGNLEKLEYAVKYGADAVYLGVTDFSLRAMRKGELITLENLPRAVGLAHELGAKAYLTLNVFAFNNDIERLEGCAERFAEAKPEAVILSDFGIFNLVRKSMPEIPVHVSTQTNTLNYESVKFWRDLGAKRVILARELGVADMAQIRAKVPDIELECFVHGAQCVSFSGRCLLSDYFSGGERKANSGNCCQPCRWSHKLVEETRPGEYYEIHQDERGSHILCPKDLCLVKRLPELIDAGIDSFKIEGRTKSLYYVSAVAKVYRAALNGADPDKCFEELLKVGNRGYTEGFAFGQGGDYNYEVSKGLAGVDFLFEFWDQNLVKIKNKIHVGDEVEIITPDEQFTTTVLEIQNETGIGNTNDEVLVKFSQMPKDYRYAIGRRT